MGGKRVRGFLLMIAWLGVVLTAPAFAAALQQGPVPEGLPLSRAEQEAWVAERLDGIIDAIEPISETSRFRRRLAHATFCLPQNLLGIAYYAFAEAIGSVLTTAEINEVTVVATRLPFGASLGRYLFIPDVLLSERTVRHEYGHTMQGYRHGPFYLLLEGVVSFVRSTASIFFPAIAETYFDRWPESEADELGAVR